MFFGIVLYIVPFVCCSHLTDAFLAVGTFSVYFCDLGVKILASVATRLITFHLTF